MHKLGNDSGGDANSRFNESREIIKIVDEVIDEVNPKEYDFLEQVSNQDYCTVRQLFWLRDIKDKYL